MVIVYHSAHIASPMGPLLAALATLRGALWCGVDLFFVLSGFLITRILLATRNRPHYFRSFFIRRAVRIFPLYYGLLVALFVVTPWLATALGGPAASLTASRSYEALFNHQVWLWTYTQNFLQARGPSQLPGLGHFWSLAIEEQFYLVWPALVWVVARGDRALHHMVTLCLTLLAAVLAVRIALVLNGASPWAVFHLTYTRCDALACGALAAAVASDEGLADRLKPIVGAVLPLALAGWLACGVVAGGWGKASAPMQTVGYTLIAVGFAAWIFRIVMSGSVDRGPLTSPRLRTLGKHSYAMYLFHWPLCRATEAWLAPFNLPTLCDRLLLVTIVLAGSFLIALVSWRVWEQPWLRLKRYAPY